jgi:hypothetical protein
VNNDHQVWRGWQRVDQNWVLYLRFPAKTPLLKAGASFDQGVKSGQNGTSSAGGMGSSIALASVFSAVGEPRNWTREAMISVRCRFPPLFFASNSRVRSRPST